MSEPVIFYSGPIVTRAEAKALGLKHYFTGVPCKHGHLSKMTTKTGNCMKCKSEHENRQKKLNPCLYKEKRKKYFYNNREKYLLKMKEYNSKNAETIKLKRKEKTILYGILNRKKITENNRKWRIKNPQGYLSHVHKRRERLLQGRGFTQKQIDIMLVLQKHKCINCKSDISKKFNIDHIMPLSLGGLNDIKNIQLLCPKCNNKKHAKHPIDWALENGRLV